MLTLLHPGKNPLISLFLPHLCNKGVLPHTPFFIPLSLVPQRLQASLKSCIYHDVELGHVDSFPDVNILHSPVLIKSHILVFLVVHLKVNHFKACFGNRHFFSLASFLQPNSLDFPLRRCFILRGTQ